MKKPPYPALVKPDAVVLLPPEESEERLPRGLWPEERRRPPWVMPVVIGAIFVAGLGLGLRLASRSPSATPDAPQAVEGPFEAVGAGEDVGAEDVGAMDAAVAPDAPPPASARREGLPAPVGSPPTWDGVTGGSRSAGAAPPPAVALGQGREPEPDIRADLAGQGTEVALGQGSAPDREPRSQPPGEEPRREAVPPARDEAEATPPDPAVSAPPQPVDSTPLELSPAPVGRTTIVPVEPIELAARSAVALEPPAPDPAVVREAARRSLLRGAERFASAVGQARTGTTGALSGQILASDGPARDLLRFVQQSKPGASVVRVGEVTVRDGTAQADATLQFEWRGDFGVTRRGSVRVRLLAREGDDGWSVAGGQPLDGLPR